MNVHVLPILTLGLLGLLAGPVGAVCTHDSEICAEGPETRTINGLAVYRDCWRHQSAYTCAGTTAVEDAYCQELRDRGCIAVGQTCNADGCTLEYQCQSGGSTVQTGQGCESQTVSMGSVTYDTGYSANTDFGVAAANASAIEDAVTGMISNDLSCYEDPPGSGSYTCIDDIAIFSGNGKSCRKDSFGFNKCCSLGGWGVDAGFNVCSAEEHELGYAREALRTHYIGRYCSHSNVFGCFAHAYVYCVFNSKIGRIIQEQGRVQLGIGWGSPQAPNCRGLTEVEIASINFDLIDFSEYFGDVFAEIGATPSNTDMQSIVDGYINRLQSAGCSQIGDQGCVQGAQQ